MLPKMLIHLNKNKFSLISKIFGVYRVKMPGGVPIYLTLQQNCININRRNKILTVLDMKGSSYKRNVLDLNQRALFLT